MKIIPAFKVLIEDCKIGDYIYNSLSLDFETYYCYAVVNRSSAYFQPQYLCNGILDIEILRRIPKENVLSKFGIYNIDRYLLNLTFD